MVKPQSAEPRVVGGETDLPTGALGVMTSRTTATSPFWFVDPLLVHIEDTSPWRWLLHAGASCACYRPFLCQSGAAGCVAEEPLGPIITCPLQLPCCTVGPHVRCNACGTVSGSSTLSLGSQISLRPCKWKRESHAWNVSIPTKIGHCTFRGTRGSGSSTCHQVTVSSKDGITRDSVFGLLFEGWTLSGGSN